MVVRPDLPWLIIAAVAAASALFSGVLAILNAPAIVWDHYRAAPMVVAVLTLICVGSATVAWFGWRRTTWAKTRQNRKQ